MTTKSVSKICLVDDCGAIATRQQRCDTHYRQYRRSENFVGVHNRGTGNTTAERFWSRVNIGSADECWEWQGSRNKFGYGTVNIQNLASKAHRAAWFFTYGRLPALCILHSCDNPACCNPAHLREGTHQDNSDDKRIRGRQAYGEQVKRGHLTNINILAIRSAYRLRNATQIALASQYQVCRQTIADIVHRKTWRHIP